MDFISCQALRTSDVFLMRASVNLARPVRPPRNLEDAVSLTYNCGERRNLSLQMQAVIPASPAKSQD